MDVFFAMVFGITMSVCLTTFIGILAAIWGMGLGQEQAVDKTRQGKHFEAYGKHWVAVEADIEKARVKLG